MMTTEYFEGLLSQKERIDLEFKKAEAGLPKSAFESVCAFLNRQGGYLILGARDDGHPNGIVEELADDMQKEFANLSNNSTNLSPPFLLELQSIRIHGKLLLYVYVPQSSQVHSHKKTIYDRGHEGDFKIVDDASISQIYSRKSALFSESRIFPFLDLSAFKPGILNQVRKLIRNNRPDNPLLALDDDDFLRATGLYRTDYTTGQKGYTLASALLLGKDEVIQSILPHFRIDAILRRHDTDRYDDRVDIRTNLVDAYDQIMNFAANHLPDKFHLDENMRRVSLREKIFREVVANVLVHREYTNAMPANFIIYTDRVEVGNANKPNKYGPINPKTFSPFPKNPTIAKFFAHLGRVDELGSGVRNVTKFLKIYYPGTKANFVEEDIFKTLIPIPSTGVKETLISVLPSIDELIPRIKELGLSLKATERLVGIVGILQEGETVPATSIAAALDVIPRTMRRDISILHRAGIIEAGVDYGTYKLASVNRMGLQ